MLERQSRQLANKHTLQTTIKYQPDHIYEDLVLSLSHRLSIIETGLQSKIDRAECMLILENKANHSQLAKMVEQLNNKITNYEKIALSKLAEQQKTNIIEQDRLKQKLKGKKKQKSQKKSNHNHDKNMLLIKPQQLYLQSNETMFNIIVDEISTIMEAHQSLEKNLQQRNKMALSLNNQICQKIQHLEHKLETTIKLFRYHEKQSVPDQGSQSWSNQDQKVSKIKQSRTGGYHRTSINKQNGGNEPHQLTHLMKNMENMQKDISNKMNIKDILPIIKKSIHPLSQLIEQIKNYTEEAIQSTKKILINQSQINQQLCIVSKLCWWQSFEQKDGFAVWNKQVVNLVPENFVCQKDSNLMIIVQQGNYVFKILSPTNEQPDKIVVGGNQVEFDSECLIKIDKNTVVQVPSEGNQLFISIQKI